MAEDTDSVPEHWPEDDLSDPDWPDDWPPATGADEADRAVASGFPRQGGRGRRTLALALTATIALGAGAGAVYLYRSLQGGVAVSAASSGASGGAGPSSPAGRGNATSLLLLGPVLAVGRDTVTVGGGPVGPVSARVTSATRFTGADQSLAQVRVGDIVTVQITRSGGVTSVASLQDPSAQ
jgi:hypothetical protein